MEPSTSTPAPPRRSPKVRLWRQALESLLGEIQRALDVPRDDDGGDPVASLPEETAEAPEHEGGGGNLAASLASDSGYEMDQLCDLLKSIESPGFFKTSMEFKSQYIKMVQELSPDQIKKALKKTRQTSEGMSWDKGRL